MISKDHFLALSTATDASGFSVETAIHDHATGKPAKGYNASRVVIEIQPTGNPDLDYQALKEAHRMLTARMNRALSRVVEESDDDGCDGSYEVTAPSHDHCLPRP